MSHVDAAVSANVARVGARIASISTKSAVVVRSMVRNEKDERQSGIIPRDKAASTQQAN